MTQNQAIEELKKFKELLDINAITQEEFEAKKKALMPIMMAPNTKNEVTVKTTVSQSSAKSTMQKEEDSSSSGCLVWGIVVAVVLCIILFFANFVSTPSSSSSTTFHDVKVLSQENFESRLKKVLRDPDSYQCIDYKIEHVSGDNYKAILTFRARNGFGGMNISTYQGDLIWKEGSSSYSLGHITEIE